EDAGAARHAAIDRRRLVNGDLRPGAAILRQRISAFVVIGPGERRRQVARPDGLQRARIDAAAGAAAADLIQIALAAARASRVLRLIVRRDFVFRIRLRRDLDELLVRLPEVV